MFTCNVTSKPQVDVEWIRNGSLLAGSNPRVTTVIYSTDNCNDSNPSGDVCTTYSALIVSNTVQDDNGEYVCWVSYNGENYSNAVQLIVHSKLI